MNDQHTELDTLRRETQAKMGARFDGSKAEEFFEEYEKFFRDLMGCMIDLGKCYIKKGAG